ncbi:UDP-N-acetylmuramoyl-L-alanine--D-glutamate ligase [bacterium]|nr:UDP-N-acetylmuramoyl-L-alanine--D-glutamate ligase [bacterium]
MTTLDKTYVSGKAVSILGAARSGMAVAALLSRHGAKVFVSEFGQISAQNQSVLEDQGIAWEENGHTARVLESEWVVISPGVPSKVAIVQECVQQGKPVVSEIEVASWFCKAPIVAITGSNGKTTTTELLGHVFRKSGRTTWVCGNVGTPFATVCDQSGEDDVVVLEVSSFQLDHITSFRPHVALLLNITPDHLDRYDYNFELYAASKLSISQNQKESDALVINSDDPAIRDRMPVSRVDGPGLYTFSLEDAPEKALEQAVEGGAYLDKNSLHLHLNNQNEKLMYVDELALRGRHNVYNSLAAAVAARVMEVRSDVVRESLRTFSGVPHRLEVLREIDGVRYINDSKATNVNAVWFALESFSETVVLIAGGRDKGNDYSSLKPLVTSRVRALITIGEAAERMHAELGSCTQDSVIAESLDDAVKLAHLLAKPGDVVLLSPACASFDMFDSYEHRGDQFKQIVSNL